MEPCTHKAEMITISEDLLALLEGWENADNYIGFF